MSSSQQSKDPAEDSCAFIEAESSAAPVSFESIPHQVLRGRRPRRGRGRGRPSLKLSRGVSNRYSPNLKKDFEDLNVTDAAICEEDKQNLETLDIAVDPVGELDTSDAVKVEENVSDPIDEPEINMGKGEKKKILDIMSQQFNSGPASDNSRGSSPASMKPKRGSKGGRPPKRKYVRRDAMEITDPVEGTSIDTVNPPAKRAKKDVTINEKSKGNIQPKYQKKKAGKKYDSEESKLEEIAKLLDDTEPGWRDDEFLLQEDDDITEDKDTDLKEEQVEEVDPDEYQESENFFSLDTYDCNSSDNYRGRGMRNRGRLSLVDRISPNLGGRGKSRSLSPAIGKDSPGSESSGEISLAKGRKKLKQADDKHGLLASTSVPPKGRGRGKSSQSESASAPLGKQKLLIQSSKIDMPLTESVSTKLKKSEDMPTAAVAPASADTQSVSSPAALCKSGKKKKKHFKGLRYSFGKTKKKPKKSKSRLSALSATDMSQDNESVGSEDVDDDSLDSSSQDGHKSMLMPGEIDPYDPTNEFDDNQADKSEPLSLRHQRKVSQLSIKDQINNGDKGDSRKGSPVEQCENLQHLETDSITFDDGDEEEEEEDDDEDWNLVLQQVENEDEDEDCEEAADDVADDALDLDYVEDEETEEYEETEEVEDAEDSEEQQEYIEEEGEQQEDEEEIEGEQQEEEEELPAFVKPNEYNDEEVAQLNLISDSAGEGYEEMLEEAEEDSNAEGDNEGDVEGQSTNDVNEPEPVDKVHEEEDDSSAVHEYEAVDEKVNAVESDNEEEGKEKIDMEPPQMSEQMDTSNSIVQPPERSSISREKADHEESDSMSGYLSNNNSHIGEEETSRDSHGSGENMRAMKSKMYAHSSRKKKPSNKSNKIELSSTDETAVDFKDDYQETFSSCGEGSRKMITRQLGLTIGNRQIDDQGGDSLDGVRKSKRLSRHNSAAPLAIAAPSMTNGIANHEDADIYKEYFADKTLTNVLCKCRVKENPRAVNLSGDIYCQAIDSYDGRMIGCCNIVSNHSYLRVSGKIPFMLLCNIHRHRLRRHHCCPGCGLFCTQGSFVECRWDKLGSRHYFHKLCGLILSGNSLCPHCGTDQSPIEVYLELKLSRKPVVYLKQHQEKKGFLSSARMSLVKNSDSDLPAVPPDPTLDENIPLEMPDGKVVTAAGLPVHFGRHNLIEAIKAIKAGKSFNIKPAPKAIYWSCKQGDLEKLLHVLVNGLSPNSKVKEYGNQTGLHTASTHGCIEACHILILSGAALDYTDSQLMTPLMLAVTKTQNEIVSYLVQAGASLLSKTQDGMTALHLAAKAGNFTACRHIVDSGRLTRHAINIQDEGGWTPLVWASENRCISIVKILLDRGANPQICDVEQNTALHWAAFSGSTHICSMVLDRGCSLRSMNAIGDTPLHIAARQNHAEAVVLLLARGACLEIKNAKGQTPLDCAFPETEVFLHMTLSKKLTEALDEIGLKNDRILSSDIAAGKESVPIPCVNGEDGEGLPKDYIYISENCEAFNVNIDRTLTSMKWCECEDGCNSENCICSQLNFQCWYDPEGRLLSDFNYIDPPMIFECNRACGCNKLSCHNRVVQHGMTAHLQLFKTNGKGWGVRALKDIPKGSYVCEYVGEIITDLEADQREDDSYLFDLDNRDSETFCIDARQYANIARFINHICEPNLTPVKVFIDHQDLIFPRIAFFANRDIEADQELGFDYGEKFWVIKYKHFTCMCRSPRCKYSSETIHATLENYNRKIKELQKAEHDHKMLDT